MSIKKFVVVVLLLISLYLMAIGLHIWGINIGLIATFLYSKDNKNV